MKLKLKIVKFSGERKIIEIPKFFRDDYKIGEKVIVMKDKRKNKIRKRC